MNNLPAKLLKNVAKNSKNTIKLTRPNMPKITKPNTPNIKQAIADNLIP